ncbi:F0F1 ATP synthase subunit delta [Flocculibacter collagenilyticus]|uniref:F0F1 ATP synthase subunit delta n=1 Tax=Flocculibacter collagenilyticus TaxID=2744479 RepID=UPI0018F2F789|nr:F0F1 ATP synthase subunit delta [Flocculibacter collagenilyticus]
MSELTTVARPYAKAAFDFAVEQGAIDKWLEMLVFASEVAKNEAMVQFINGAASPDKMSGTFIQICGEQLNEHGQNLIKVMAENGRLPALPGVADMFAELKAEYEKEVTVDVASATTLSDAQQDKLSAALEHRLARKVKLNCSVDPTVVGGMVIRAGDTVIDGSIRGKLNRLADTLQS